MIRILMATVFLLIVACSDKETNPHVFKWTKLGLDGKIINEMTLHNSVLFVSSSDGMYKKDINSAEGFSPLGLEGRNVEDFIVFNSQRIVATVVDRSLATPSGLFITENGGQTWQEIAHDFGGAEGEPILDLAIHPDDENTWYGTGFGVVAKSTNGGVSWQPIWGEWQTMGTGVSVVTHNPFTNEIWAGGQGAIENGFLLRSSDEVAWDSWYDLADNPTVVKEIVFGDAGQMVLAGYEGALVGSYDNGDHWTTLIPSDENRFFFGIGISSNNHSHVFAAGWLKTWDEQPLRLFFSTNKGATWKTESYSPEQFGGVYDMVVKSENGRERVFLGLYKGGVYEVTVNPYGNLRD